MTTAVLRDIVILTSIIPADWLGLGKLRGGPKASTELAFAFYHIDRCRSHKELLAALFV
jgi:hypothetical protein